MNQVIDYALCYLNANWDEYIEEDLGMSQDHFIALLKKFQKSIEKKKATN